MYIWMYEMNDASNFFLLSFISFFSIFIFFSSFFLFILEEIELNFIEDAALE